MNMSIAFNKVSIALLFLSYLKKYGEFKHTFRISSCDVNGERNVSHFNYPMFFSRVKDEFGVKNIPDYSRIVESGDLLEPLRSSYHYIKDFTLGDRVKVVLTLHDISDANQEFVLAASYINLKTGHTHATGRQVISMNGSLPNKVNSNMMRFSPRMIHHTTVAFSHTNIGNYIKDYKYAELLGNAREIMAVKTLPQTMAGIGNDFFLKTSKARYWHFRRVFVGQEVVASVGIGDIKEFCFSIRSSFLSGNQIVCYAEQKLAFTDLGGNLIAIPENIKNELKSEVEVAL